MVNILNGGKHAGGKLKIQEFMILPSENFDTQTQIQAVCEVYYKLQKIEAFDRRIGVLNNVSGSEALTNISSSRRRKEEIYSGKGSKKESKGQRIRR